MCYVQIPWFIYTRTEYPKVRLIGLSHSLKYNALSPPPAKMDKSFHRTEPGQEKYFLFKVKKPVAICKNVKEFPCFPWLLTIFSWCNNFPINKLSQALETQSAKQSPANHHTPTKQPCSSNMQRFLAPQSYRAILGTAALF